MRTESLVRKIMVRVDLRHIDGDDPTSDMDQAMLDADGKLLSKIERRRQRRRGRAINPLRLCVISDDFLH